MISEVVQRSVVEQPLLAVHSMVHLDFFHEDLVLLVRAFLVTRAEPYGPNRPGIRS